MLKKGKSKFDDYIKKIVGDIDVSDFLNKYEMCFEGNGRIDFYKYLGIELGVIDKNIGEVNRKYMKGLILYLINGERGDGMRKRYLNNQFSYDEIMEKIFCKGGYEVIEKIKNSDIDFKLKGENYYGYERFKNMSRVLMSMEVLIMRGIWKKLIERKIYYISLYDGMLIKKSDLGIVNILIDSELEGLNSCISFKSK